MNQPTVLLGVTGCIAAYKACEILRGLQKAGVDVRVVMTRNASEFVGPTTFAALSHHPVGLPMFFEPAVSSESVLSQNVANSSRMDFSSESASSHEMANLSWSDFSFESNSFSGVNSGGELDGGISSQDVPKPYNLPDNGVILNEAIPHIELGQHCDLFLIAPCTANVLAKLAHGLADDLLTSTALACTAPIMVAPAMNMHMYENAATRDNIACLRRRGIEVIDADSGYEACGDEGPGRLPEPDVIVSRVLEKLGMEETSQSAAVAEPESFQRDRVDLTIAQSTNDHQSPTDSESDENSLVATREMNRTLHSEAEIEPIQQDLLDINVLITAGPTVERIDPVRYLTNDSSGKMGYALAESAARRGAQVTLVSGPTALACPDSVTRISVESAREMLEACEESFTEADVIICAAAVADYRPAMEASQKIKKDEDNSRLQTLILVENPDILKTLASARRPGQVVVGFAAETNNILEYAREKLSIKGTDMMVANQVGKGLTFGSDDDKAWLLVGNDIEDLPTMSKALLADRILDRVKTLLPKA